MHENEAKLNRCKRLLENPPKVDRNKVPLRCGICPYFQPDFRYRKCLYASCPYGKGSNDLFRKRPLKEEKIVAGGGGMRV
jgi:hypothetical protein